MASATDYVDNITVDPTTFSCGYFGNSEICGGFTAFTDGPRIFNASDQVTENVTFSSPLSVPGSTSSNTIYVGLPDYLTLPAGPPGAGPNIATITTTLLGYSGSPVPIGDPTYTYTPAAGSNHEYIGVGGFCCGYGEPNNGYSATGIDVNFAIGYSDPYAVYGTSYGFSVVLPATPQLISNIQGGTPGHPAILPAGQVGQVSVDLATQGQQDYYGFNWDGGLFQATGSVADAPSDGSYGYQLLGANGDVIDGATLDNSDGFSATLSDVLSAGFYEIGLTDNTVGDPLATIHFDTPVAGVPEPATWAMMLAGMFGVGGALRYARRREPVKA